MHSNVCNYGCTTSYHMILYDFIFSDIVIQVKLSLTVFVRVVLEVVFGVWKC